MKNKSARTLWGDFLDQHLEYAFAPEPRVTQLRDIQQEANSALQLVLEGKKRARSHSLLGLQFRNEPLPRIGDFTIFTDWEGNAQCVVRTVGVTLRPLFSVPASHAKLEGQGDGSLESWKKSHWEYFTRELEPFGKTPTESMIVVCEVFEKVYGRG
ncbi:ASCH domain-containing protein [Robiginitalea marina]|uniref:ASCH domain-containing protein n=1 Tax=Robiginitalea marina TaxID=2954105 RepID=A0ABT1AWR0_9FLAO|nr:ASCH domain-containing protein [Robiginitalea marina]MCO5724359.1 ASCH domain-containing protein [Robiginitalea marina]